MENTPQRHQAITTVSTIGILLSAAPIALIIWNFFYKGFVIHGSESYIYIKIFLSLTTIISFLGFIYLRKWAIFLLFSVFISYIIVPVFLETTGSYWMNFIIPIFGLFTAYQNKEVFR